MLFEIDFFSSYKDFEGVGFFVCFKLDGYEDLFEMEFWYVLIYDNLMGDSVL